MKPSATPAIRNNIDVAKFHACHAKCRVVTGDQVAPSAPPEPAGAIKSRVPRKAKVDVAKCHACHAKRRYIDVGKCHACHAKVPRGHGRARGSKRAARANPVPKRHARHAKRR